MNYSPLLLINRLETVSQPVTHFLYDFSYTSASFVDQHSSFVRCFVQVGAKHQIKSGPFRPLRKPPRIR